MKDESDTGARFFDLADLTVGDFVEIKGFIDNEGHNIATKMKRENENKDDKHETKLKGTVSNILDFSFDIVGVNVSTNETAARFKTRNKSFGVLIITIFIAFFEFYFTDHKYFIG